MSAPTHDARAGWQLGQIRVIVGFWGFLCRSWCFQSQAFQWQSSTHICFFHRQGLLPSWPSSASCRGPRLAVLGCFCTFPSLLSCSPGALSSPFEFSERHQMHVLPQMALRSGCNVCLCFFLFPKAVGCHFQ